MQKVPVMTLNDNIQQMALTASSGLTSVVPWKVVVSLWSCSQAWNTRNPPMAYTVYSVC